MGGNLDHISVWSCSPFWRWAIIPLNVVGDTPAIPFFRKRDAERMALEFSKECGGSVMLLRRRGWRTFELGGQVRDERL